MAIPTRMIKRRIKSIRSTGKIMRAMELVAASKMRKATQMTLATRPYSHAVGDLATRVRQLIDPSRHPLLLAGSATSNLPTLLIIAASDRGLCGGFNNQLIKKALEFLRTRQDEVRFVMVGRRAEAVARQALATKRVARTAASFEAISNAPSFDRALPVAHYALKEFLEGRVSRVFMCYTDFKSALSQIPNVIQLLPVGEAEDIRNKRPTSVKTSAGRQETRDKAASDLFEPDPDAVLNSLLPRLLEMQIYQALLESSASEHSARMMAMRSAGDAAGEMLEDLTFTLNQARQAVITREISEISAGKAAIE